MSRAATATFFALIFSSTAFGALSGCGTQCKVTSQCETGEHCDFTTGDCVKGCTSNSDCPVSGDCNLETGKCRIIDPGPQTPRDTGTTTTSTTPGPDASLGD